MNFRKAVNGTTYIAQEEPFGPRYVVRKVAPADRQGRKIWEAQATVWNPLGAVTDWTSPQSTRADAVEAANEYIAANQFDYIPLV